jgi:hemolysin III
MMTDLPPYSAKEELANAFSHGLGALLSAFGLIMLLTYSVANSAPENELIRMVSFSIYGTSLILLFLASTFYHAIVNQPIKKLFKLLDHCAIYILIAGTYTPLLLISLQGTLGNSLMIVIWGIALGGIIFKIKFGNKFKKTSLITYLGMGFISFAILGELYKILPSEAIALLAIGGFVYCLGVFFYVQKKIPFNHAIWHLFVLAGASCHFVMIYRYV